MRRRARIPPRPPLTRRAIVAFPQAAPLDEVEAFRRRNDPLAASLRAHITLVFPFASTLSALQVATHVRRVAASWPVLPVRIEDVDAYGWQRVHLRVTRGQGSIVELHDRLYRRVLAPFLRREFDYAPHVTVGRADDVANCERMLRDARVAFPRPLDAVLRSLSILALPPDGSLSVEAEIPLGN
jgi:2'-5' RNA ligase